MIKALKVYGKCEVLGKQSKEKIRVIIICMIKHNRKR